MKSNYLKLVMLGEGRVGKTSLTLRYCQGQFDDQQESTINASYLEKTVILDNDEQVQVAIWDTAGQEKFNALAPMYYRDALGAVIVYDITFKESFEKVQKWVQELKQFADKDIVLCIAGNKCDIENMRQIKREDAQDFAKKLGAVHFDTSAKANVGIDDLFKFMLNEVNKRQQKKKGLGGGRNNKKKNQGRLKVGGKVNKDVSKDIYNKNQEQDSDDDNIDSNNLGNQNNQYSDSDEDDKKKKPKQKSSKKENIDYNKQDTVKLKAGKKKKEKKDGCC